MKNRDGYEVDDFGSVIHRLVYARAHGAIAPGWVVHHIDSDKLNNTIDNLIALPECIHNLLHTFQRKHRRKLQRREIESFMERKSRGFPKKKRIKPKKPEKVKQIKVKKPTASPQELVLLKEMKRKWPALFPK